MSAKIKAVSQTFPGLANLARLQSTTFIGFIMPLIWS
jgi:hypothetical protein